MADIENQSQQQNLDQSINQNNRQHTYNDSDLTQNMLEKQSEGLFASSRLGFIRKVYLILVAQLLLTVLMTAASMYYKQFSQFQLQNLWLLWTALGVMFVVEIVLVCFQKVARKVPVNYICLFIFTLCMSYSVSLICAGVQQSSNDGSRIVLIAAAMTFGVVVALTIYALTTKTDFTVMGGFLFSFVMLMIIFGIVLIFQYSTVLNTIYCVLGCILYSLYLIFDTQLIAGGKRYSLSYDDYIIGALMLYIDIIILFLKILKLLDGK